MQFRFNTLNNKKSLEKPLFIGFFWLFYIVINYKVLF